MCKIGLRPPLLHPQCPARQADRRRQETAHHVTIRPSGELGTVRTAVECDVMLSDAGSNPIAHHLPYCFATANTAANTAATPRVASPCACAVLPFPRLPRPALPCFAPAAAGPVFAQVLNLQGSGTRHSPGPRVGAAMAALSSTEALLFGGLTFDASAAGAWVQQAVCVVCTPCRCADLCARLPSTV